MASSEPSEPVHAPYHRGERLVQDLARESARAERAGAGVWQELPPVAAAFLRRRSWVVVATADAAGRPWASVLAGPAGFVSVPEPGELRLAASPRAGDPVAAGLGAGAVVGFLAVDLDARQRARVNGRVIARDETGVRLRVDQAYGNCSRYIHRRLPREAASEPVPITVERRDRLTPEDREWIRRTDTFFIGTVNPGEGADASHRGGPPGFLEVDGDRITWPEYHGNAMFNTLGNIASHGRAGLLLPDFDADVVLLLTGRAGLDWDPEAARLRPGAERLVHLEVEELARLSGGFPFRGARTPEP